MRNKVRKAFTLVEILIVVVILGILAAIVIPQFTSATEDAQAGNLKAQIQSLQNQIELFRARNNSTNPFATNVDWRELRGDMNNDGTADAGAEVYIKKDPTNPAFPGAVKTGLEVTAGATGSANNAWVYDDVKNELYASYFDEVTGKVTPTVP